MDGFPTHPDYCQFISVPSYTDLKHLGCLKLFGFERWLHVYLLSMFTHFHLFMTLTQSCSPLSPPWLLLGSNGIGAKTKNWSLLQWRIISFSKGCSLADPKSNYKSTLSHLERSNVHGDLCFSSSSTPTVGEGQEEATKIIREIEQLCYEERLKSWGCLAWRREYSGETLLWPFSA